MNSDRLFSEIFQEFQDAKTKEDKINVLRKYDHPIFRQFFVMLYNKNIKFDVEVPNYRPAPEPAGLNWTYLSMEIPKLYRFIVGHPRRTNITPEKQKSLLVVILESLHKDEADILVKLIKKDLGIKYLTPKTVKEAFPDIEL